MRTRFQWKNAALTLGSLLIVCGLTEAGAFLWLKFVASDQQLLVYGTLKQNSDRLSGNNETETFDKARLTYTPHRYIGYIPAPNFRRGLNYHNSLGFRGTEFPAEKPAGEFRIACLGGSTTYGPDVDDPQLAYPAQLENVLKERGFNNVRVINAGAAGWTSYETLSNFVYRVRYLNPDLILIYHGVNDAAARMVYPYVAYRGDNSGFMSPPSVAPPEPLYLKSNAVRCLYIRMGWTASPMSLHQTMGGLTASGLYFQFLSQYGRGAFPSGIFDERSITDLFSHNPPVYFLENLNSLIVLSRRLGIQPVLLTFHINGQIQSHYSYPEFVAGVEAQNESVKKLADETDVPLCDFATLFPNEPSDYVDSIHLNEAGSRRQAEVVADFLIERDLVR